ncbi:MAG: DUF6141 family protein [Methanomethylovorans sp.]|uniref:DUF6141 family protein n=1 Tax=Methanomethylovorans sp. TaxID=2758717 RepID=UPI001BD4874D|nr:DUF6141 family protein [Methanomethylovorans sp.]
MIKRSVSMSAIRSENSLVFQEKQYFDKWKNFFVLAVVMVTINAVILLYVFYIFHEVPSLFLFLVAIPVLVFMITFFLFSKMEMTTEVRYDGLYIRYLPTQRTFRYFPFESIESSQRSKGEMLDRINNWRIRSYPNRTIYQCGSSEKVLIKLVNGKTLLIDSKSPDELIAAISSMKKM